MESHDLGQSLTRDRQQKAHDRQSVPKVLEAAGAERAQHPHRAGTGEGTIRGVAAAPSETAAHRNATTADRSD